MFGNHEFMCCCAVALQLFLVKRIHAKTKQKYVFFFFHITRNKVYKAQMTYALYNNLVVRL